MIQITPQMRILLAREPADFRKGIDGLAQVCREGLGEDPFSGFMFVFRNNVESRIMWSRRGKNGPFLARTSLGLHIIRDLPGTQEACHRVGTVLAAQPFSALSEPTLSPSVKGLRGCRSESFQPTDGPARAR